MSWRGLILRRKTDRRRHPSDGYWLLKNSEVCQHTLGPPWRAAAC